MKAGKVFTLSFHREDHWTGLKVKRIPVHAGITVSNSVNDLTFILPVIANKTDVVESTESDRIVLPGVELPILHIWNVWPGVVTFLHHSDGGIIVDQGAKTILRVGEHKLGHPDV